MTKMRGGLVGAYNGRYSHRLYGIGHGTESDNL